MTCPACRARFRAVLVALGEAHGVELLTMAQRLDPTLRLDVGEGRITPGTFELRAREVRRAPSGTMAAVHDTDPAPGPIPREEPE